MLRRYTILIGLICSVVLWCFNADPASGQKLTFEDPRAFPYLGENSVLHLRGLQLSAQADALDQQAARARASSAGGADESAAMVVQRAQAGYRRIAAAMLEIDHVCAAGSLPDSDRVSVAGITLADGCLVVDQCLDTVKNAPMTSDVIWYLRLFVSRTEAAITAGSMSIPTVSGIGPSDQAIISARTQGDQLLWNLLDALVLIEPASVTVADPAAGPVPGAHPDGPDFKVVPLTESRQWISQVVSNFAILLPPGLNSAEADDSPPASGADRQTPPDRAPDHANYPDSAPVWESSALARPSRLLMLALGLNSLDRMVNVMGACNQSHFAAGAGVPAHIQREARRLEALPPADWFRTESSQGSGRLPLPCCVQTFARMERIIRRFDQFVLGDSLPGAVMTKLQRLLADAQNIDPMTQAGQDLWAALDLISLGIEASDSQSDWPTQRPIRQAMTSMRSEMVEQIGSMVETLVASLESVRRGAGAIGENSEAGGSLSFSARLADPSFVAARRILEHDVTRLSALAQLPAILKAADRSIDGNWSHLFWAKWLPAAGGASGGAHIDTINPDDGMELLSRFAAEYMTYFGSREHGAEGKSAARENSASDDLARVDALNQSAFAHWCAVWANPESTLSQYDVLSAQLEAIARLQIYVRCFDRAAGIRNSAGVTVVNNRLVSWQVAPEGEPILRPGPFRSAVLDIVRTKPEAGLGSIVRSLAQIERDMPTGALTWLVAGESDQNWGDDSHRPHTPPRVTIGPAVSVILQALRLPVVDPQVECELRGMSSELSRWCLAVESLSSRNLPAKPPPQQTTQHAQSAEGQSARAILQKIVNDDASHLQRLLMLQRQHIGNMAADPH